MRTYKMGLGYESFMVFGWKVSYGDLKRLIDAQRGSQEDTMDFCAEVRGLLPRGVYLLATAPYPDVYNNYPRMTYHISLLDYEEAANGGDAGVILDVIETWWDVGASFMKAELLVEEKPMFMVVSSSYY